VHLPPTVRNIDHQWSDTSGRSLYWYRRHRGNGGGSHDCGL